MLRGAKHLNACRTKAQRHHQSHTCAPFYSPARGGKPPSDSPARGGKKGGCRAARSEASQRLPDQNTAKPPNPRLSDPSASARCESRFFAALRMTRVGRGNGDPRALIFGHAKHTCLESWMHSKWPCSTVFGMTSAHHSSNSRRRAMPMPCVVLRPMPA